MQQRDQDFLHSGDSVGQTSGATQPCLNPEFSERIGDSRPTGFGTTYFGGNRDPGPFDLDAAKNKPWESQFGLIKKLFTGLAWWTLEPHDELVTAGVRRGPDGKHLERLAPPETTYWALATPGQQYIVYVRGLAETVSIHLENGRELRARQFDPRIGAFTELPPPAAGPYRYQPPDRQDWVVVVTRK